MKDGRIIAERYAEGLGIDTPLLGFSVTKSVNSAFSRGRASLRWTSRKLAGKD